MDRHQGVRLSRVDQPKQAHLVPVATRVEDRDPAPVARVRGHVEHRREKAVVGPDVHQHLDVQLARQLQPPVAAANAPGQAFPRVALLQINGVEGLSLTRVDDERDRLVFPLRIVEGPDANLASRRRAIDHAYESLPASRVVRGRKQRHDMNAVRRRWRYRG